MSRTRIAAELRQQVMTAGRFRCGYCLTSQQIVGPLLELDHYVPESQGGLSTEDNLCVACPMCNSHKADRVRAIDPESTRVWAGTHRKSENLAIRMNHAATLALTPNPSPACGFIAILR